MATVTYPGLYLGKLAEMDTVEGTTTATSPAENSSGVLGHVDKWRSQRRIDVMSMKPRKLSAVLS